MQTKDDLKRMEEDMNRTFQFMDSEEGKKLQNDYEQIAQDIKELEKNDEVVYPITKRMIQEFAEEEIDRELSDEEIHEVLGKVCCEIDSLLKEAIEEVNVMTELWENAIPVEEVGKHLNRFEVHARNELAYESEFSLVCAYTEEDDARYYTSKHFIYPAEEYKIEKIENGVKQIIVHHKNPLDGGDGFHMDVHDEPKDAQNHHDQNF